MTDKEWQEYMGKRVQALQEQYDAEYSYQIATYGGVSHSPKIATLYDVAEDGSSYKCIYQGRSKFTPYDPRYDSTELVGI